MSSRNICTATDLTELGSNTSLLVANDEALYKIKAVDVVVEQGTNGIWYYRKWSSGIAECWGVSTGTFNITSAWGNVYFSSGQYSYADYPFTFIDKPNCMYSIDNSGGYSIGIMTSGTEGTTTRTPLLQFFRGTSASDCYIKTHWFVIGRWK